MGLMEKQTRANPVLAPYTQSENTTKHSWATPFLVMN